MAKLRIYISLEGLVERLSREDYSPGLQTDTILVMQELGLSGTASIGEGPNDRNRKNIIAELRAQNHFGELMVPVEREDGESEKEPNETEVGEEPEVTSRGLTSEELKILLEEYSIHERESLSAEEITARIRENNPLLRRLNIGDIRQVIERKVQLQQQLEQKKLTPKEADMASDKQIVIESRLEERGVETAKAVEIAEAIVEAEVEAGTVTNKPEIKIIEKVVIADQGLTKKEVAVVAKVEADVVTTNEMVVKVKEKIEMAVASIPEAQNAAIQVEVVAVAMEIYQEPGDRQVIEEEIKQILRKAGVNSPEVRAREIVEAVYAIEKVDGQLALEYLSGDTERAVVLELFEAQDKLVPDKAEAIREYVATYRELTETVPEVVFDEQAVTNEVKAVSAGPLHWHEPTATQREASSASVKSLLRVVQTSPEKFVKITNIRKAMIGSGVQEPAIIRASQKFDAFEKINSLISKDKNLGRVLAFLQRKEAITGSMARMAGVYTAKRAIGLGIHKTIGGSLVNMGIKYIAGKEVSRFAAQTILAVGRFGLEKGLGLAIKVAATKGATVATGAVAKSVLTGMAAAANIVGGLPAWVLTVIVMAAGFLWDMVTGVFKKAGKVIDKAWAAVGIDTAKTKQSLKENLGGFLGGLAGMGVDMGMFVIGIPVMILGGLSISTLIAVLIPAVIGGIMIYQLFQLAQISQIVPPKGIGSTNCVLKEEAESSGMINCDQHAPENTVAGVSKAEFVRVANTWKSGKNYSEECFNDVVNRSLCAGINPAYSLWAWVHESGASNYSINKVEDFGIHGQPSAPPKDFSAQLNYFLKLDPGKACLGTPKIGNDYWLGFATNYLNGSCDPDEKNKTNGKTGREYAAELRATWGWVSDLPMPANIHYVGLGGQNCSGSGSSGVNDQIVSGYTDENGKEWICYDGGAGSDEGDVPDFGEWDPGLPVPEGCPHGLPTKGTFTQGPFAKGCSHNSMSNPAIDIGAAQHTPIVATHPGVAVLNHDSIYGFYIDVHGKCQGKDFYTRYGHMPQGGFRVGNNQQVTAGQKIGVVDSTGSSTGHHLHYHIVGLGKSNFGQYLGLSPEKTKQLWGCCGKWNGVSCP